MNEEIKWRNGTKVIFHLADAGAHGKLFTPYDYYSDEEQKLITELIKCSVKKIKIFGFVIEEEARNSYGIFKIFRMFLSYCFSAIFIIIIKCRSKSSKKGNEKDIKEEDEIIYNINSGSSQIDYESKKAKRRKRNKSLLFLFFLSIIQLSSYLFNYYVGDNNIKFSRNTIGVIHEIIVYFILSRIILKQKFYQHHYVTCIIIFVSSIVLFIYYFFQLEDKNNYYNILWYFLVYSLLYGLFNVLVKKYLDIFFHSIYYMLIIICIIIVFSLLVYDCFAYYTIPDKSGIFIGFSNNINNAKNIFLFLLDLILQFIFNVGIMMTIYYFTPFHFITSEFISELLKYYINLIEYNETKSSNKNNFDFIYKTNNIIIFSVLFFVNLICSLIFNEIIILKIFGMEKYTNRYLKRRAMTEVSEIFKDDDSKTSEDNTKIDENSINYNNN